MTFFSSAQYFKLCFTENRFAQRTVLNGNNELFFFKQYLQNTWAQI